MHAQLGPTLENACMSSSLTMAVTDWCSGSSTTKLSTWLNTGSLLFQIVFVRSERPSRTDISTNGSTCSRGRFY